jgi:hypothetical protein
MSKDLFPKRHGMMTVGALKEILKTVPDDTVIVTSGSDHSYEPVGQFQASMVTAEYVKKSHYFGEYWDDDSMSPGAVKIEVIVIGQ